jgi:hypothetical protein
MPLKTIVSIQNDPNLQALILKEILSKNGISQQLNQIPGDYVWSNELIICDERDLNTDVFKTNINLVEAIENMEVLMIIIGKSIRFAYKPINVQIIEKNVNVKKDLVQLIDKWMIIQEKRNKREKVLANKLNRLFYILNEFETKDEVFIEDIIKVTGVSKRTVQRDFQFIREMLINKDIELDEFNRSYVLKNLF